MTGVLRCWQHVSFKNILFLLLFLYPLFATVMRHWNSTLFMLIILLGVVYFFTKRKRDSVSLHKYEKVYLWLLAGNFFVFLLTSLINLPEDTREIRFDIEARFLLVIPLYFLLIKTEDGFKWLAYGAVISIFIALAYCIKAVFISKEHAFTGVYSHLYTAPILLIYTVIGSYGLAAWNRSGDTRKWLLLAILVIAALFTIYYTYSRVTYISILVVSALAAGLLTKKWWKLISVGAIVLAVLIAGMSFQNVKSRLSVAFDELNEYMALDEAENRVNATINTSVGTRLEMWRSVPLILRDHALVGVGNGNYNKAMQVYIDNKELNHAVLDHSHAHNVFVNVLIVKGLAGVIITCLVMFFPLYVYLKTYHYSKGTAIVGILFVTIIFLVSMNETAPFVKSNFVATYLLLSLAVFLNHMRNLKSIPNA